MEKTIEIDGKKVKFRSTGATPLRYKAQFHKDFFAEILKLQGLEKLDDKSISVEDIRELDFEVFYNIAWVMAKTADKDIPEPIDWLDTFDSFPMIEVIPQLQDLIMASIQSKKK